MPRITAAVLIGALGFATVGATADFSDPTWPCIQRKVARLSPALMWPYPIEERTFDPATEADVTDLAGRMALRRVTLDALTPRVEAFVTSHGNDPVLLGHVFTQAFDRLAGQRREIMAGIEEYSLKQIALAKRIDDTRTRMDRQMDAENPDFDKVDALEEQLAWDERIYTDRQKSLTYVCETPVLIEKRLFAVAQMLAAMVDD
ncbi:hypothetical protein RGUI_0959 [Rhodovulum sp. P5]|uniref:hypothetical protein n=1 Tax=Rhodovulum sp. P5 TaxID=1564506 RepID=UPI0009C1EBE6|nr:hypothetical protein [Rhodovulum sp. P5]ARE39100.1 hypothetical protein RGUI_0959 [Rhodovulum sp. P5]